MLTKINEVQSIQTINSGDYILLVLADGSIAKVAKGNLIPIASETEAGLISAEDRNHMQKIKITVPKGEQGIVSTLFKRSLILKLGSGTLAYESIIAIWAPNATTLNLLDIGHEKMYSINSIVSGKLCFTKDGDNLIITNNTNYSCNVRIETY